MGGNEFIRVLVKRVLKSVARSTGPRIHTNRWLRLIHELAASHPTDGEGQKFMDNLTTYVMSFKKTHPLTVVRVALMLDIIKGKVFTRVDNTFDYGLVLQSHYDLFIMVKDSDWIEAVGYKMGIGRADCGHFAMSSSILYGDDESVSTRSSACSHCVRELLDNGTRQMASDNTLILSKYAVSYLDPRNQSRVADSRRDYLRQLPNGRWVHIDWSPYKGLVAGYHSSKNKGFDVIDSPWFRQNRRAFGVELELQVTSSSHALDNMAGRVHDLLNPSGAVGEYCFFERDGSIGHGFEIVTQPTGLDIHRDKFALFLNNEEAKKGMRSHEGGSCGLHVHVGKQYLTQAQIYRVQSFLNDVRNEGMIRMIARRYGAGFCAVKPNLAKFSPYGKQSGDRYEMLNIQNDQTIEFRIFRGSLRYESVMAALEFSNALLTFCQPGEVSFTQFNAVGFKTYIQRTSMKEDTKYLRSYLRMSEDHDNERNVA
jgi:hypothetical protein